MLGATGFTSPFAGLPVVVENPFYYTTNADNTISILYLTQAVVDMTIPATINGLPVTSIGAYAFFQTLNHGGQRRDPRQRHQHRG